MTTTQTAEILKSLADETRLSLVRRLVAADCEITSSELIGGCKEVLKLSQPTLSHHLAKLVQSGVLIDRKSGTEKYYQLNIPLLKSIGINPKKI